MNKRILLTLATAALTLSACGGDATPDPALDLNVAMTQAFATVNASFTQTAQAIPTTPPPPTDNTALTPSPFPSPFKPTMVFQVTVSVPIVNCRFGPDTIYVAPYGLRYGKVREAIGKDETGNWLLVREPGGKKACWVIASAVTLQGNIASLATSQVKLPTTNSYPPPTIVNVTRDGNQVNISWNDVPLQQKDIYSENHYLLDVWICDNGQSTHKLIGTNELSVTFTDAIGCNNPSEGQIYTSSKAGYSSPVQIPWP